MDEETKSVRKAIIETIEFFSDFELHKRIWTPPCDQRYTSHAEMYNVYFDIIILDKLFPDHKEYNFTLDQVVAIDKFEIALEEDFEEMYWEQCSVIVKDPKWHELTQLAKKVYEKLLEDQTKNVDENGFTKGFYKSMKEYIIESIQTLSDLDFQKKSWTEIQISDTHPFDRIRRFFSAFANYLEEFIPLHKKYGFTLDQARSIEKLIKAINAYQFTEKYRCGFQVPNDPSWQKNVVELAQEINAMLS